MAGAELTDRKNKVSGETRPAGGGGKSPESDPMQDALLREVEEEIRQDRLKAVWLRFRGFIIGAAVTLVVAVAGYEGWKAFMASERDTASLMLTNAEIAAETDPIQATDRFRALAESGPEGFALVARLRAAALLADQGDHAAARALYDQVRSETDEPVYRDLAALLEVQSQLSEPGSIDPQSLREARDRLAPLLEPGNPWQYAAREADAVIALRLGDGEAAREAFARLKDDPAAPAGIRARSTAMHAQLTDAN